MYQGPAIYWLVSDKYDTVQWGYVCQYKYHYIQLFIHYHGETTNPATTPWLIWKEPPAQYKVIARVPLYQILSDGRI